MADLIYKDLCYKLNGIFYYIQNKLGSCHKEKQYCDALELKLKNEKIKFEREKDLKFALREGLVEGNKCDFVVEDKICIDLKAKSYITQDDFRKMLRYLKAGKYKLGLIVNLRGKKVVIKRVVNSDVEPRQ